MTVPNVEDSDKNPMADDSRPGFTARQGQYLAFIHAYTLVNGRPPAEADMQRFFRVSPRRFTRWWSASRGTA